MLILVCPSQLNHQCGDGHLEHALVRLRRADILDPYEEVDI
jgi:hypothetical protein